jgi:hypothetical protein
LEFIDSRGRGLTVRPEKTQDIDALAETLKTLAGAFAFRQGRLTEATVARPRLPSIHESLGGITIRGQQDFY